LRGPRSSGFRNPPSLGAAAGKSLPSPIRPKKKLALPDEFHEREEDQRGHRDMDPHEVVSEVLDDVAEAEQRLRQAEARMASSGLSEREGYRKIAEFIGAALRNVRVASEASKRRLKGSYTPAASSPLPLGAPTPTETPTASAQKELASRALGGEPVEKVTTSPISGPKPSAKR
jgi:hypothetical protein